MKTIVVSALVLMMFAGVAGTIQAIHASKSGLFNELYQPTHHVLTKKDVYHNASTKKESIATIKQEKELTKTVVKQPLNTNSDVMEITAKNVEPTILEETNPSELNTKIDAPRIKKEVKKPRKFKASMFSRGALDEEYIEEAKTDSAVLVP